MTTEASSSNLKKQQQQKKKKTCKSGPEVIYIFFMFNSAEHEISNAHKYKKNQEI